MSLSTYHAGPSPRPPKVLSARGTPRGRKPGAQRADCRRSAPGLRIHHRGFVLPLMVQGSGTYSASPAEPRCVPSPVTAPIREEPERSYGHGISHKAVVNQAAGRLSPAPGANG